VCSNDFKLGTTFTETFKILKKHNTFLSERVQQPCAQRKYVCYLSTVRGNNYTVSVNDECIRTGSMILTKENQSTWRKTCPIATLSTTDCIWTALESNLGLFHWQNGNCLPKLWHSHSCGRPVCSSVTGMLIILACMELCIKSSFHKDRAQNNISTHSTCMWTHAGKKSGKWPIPLPLPLPDTHTPTHTHETYRNFLIMAWRAAPSILLRYDTISLSVFLTLKLALKRRFYVITMTAEQ